MNGEQIERLKAIGSSPHTNQYLSEQDRAAILAAVAELTGEAA